MKNHKPKKSPKHVHLHVAGYLILAVLPQFHDIGHWVLLVAASWHLFAISSE